jgi:DNA-binding HxlR family transcriptional regulator/putative sterol carrier protein
MAKRAYGQFCGLVRALEIVGERWALMIIRDLLVSPKRFSDLRQGLPRIPTNILSARLKELEQAGIVRRRVLPRPSGSVVYELTEYGNELEDVVLRLGRWGARLLTKPGPEEIVTVDSMIMAMRSIFRPKAARGLDVSYELRLGEIIIHMIINNGRLKVAKGALPDADLAIKSGPAIKALLAGEVSPADAIANGTVHLSGDSRLLSRFADTFHI